MAATCYDLLAVGPDATDEEIETAFRRRARETHPDVSDHADATERFRLLTRARATLRDEERRARYDRLGHDAYADREWSAEFTATWLAVTDGWIDETGDSTGTERRDATAGHATAEESSTDAPGDDRSSGQASATDRSEGADDAGTDEREDHAAETATADRSADSATADHGADHAGAASGTADRTPGSTGSDTASSDRTGTTATAAAADSATASGGTGRTTADVGDAGLFDAGSSWVEQNRDAGRGDDGGFGIRNVEPTGDGGRVSVGRPDETELLFAVALFIGYPFFLFGTVAPAFPLAVNVTLGGLTLLLVGAALVRPAVGIVVFGAWSLVAPAAVVRWNVALGGGPVVLRVVVGACWLPFAFALLVAYEYG
jgi:molecular chaperone DnaJ